MIFLVSVIQTLSESLKSYELTQNIPKEIALTFLFIFLKSSFKLNLFNYRIIYKAILVFPDTSFPFVAFLQL